MLEILHRDFNSCTARATGKIKHRDSNSCTLCTYVLGIQLTDSNSCTIRARYTTQRFQQLYSIQHVLGIYITEIATAVHHVLGNKPIDSVCSQLELTDGREGGNRSERGAKSCNGEKT